jgi:hypothetical protein
MLVLDLVSSTDLGLFGSVADTVEYQVCVLLPPREEENVSLLARFLSFR